jgi:hypothetical protein
MPRQPRSRETQLDLEWTASLRWEELPGEVRNDLRPRLRELLEQVADAEPRSEGGRDE